MSLQGGGCFHCLGRYPEMVGRSSRKSFASYLETSFLLRFRANELRRRKNEIRKATNPGSCRIQSPSYYRLYFLVSKRGRLSLLCLSHLGQEVATNLRHYQAPCFSGNCGPKFWQKLILLKKSRTPPMLYAMSEPMTRYNSPDRHVAETKK